MAWSQNKETSEEHCRFFGWFLFIVSNHTGCCPLWKQVFEVCSNCHRIKKSTQCKNSGKMFYLHKKKLERKGPFFSFELLGSECSFLRKFDSSLSHGTRNCWYCMLEFITCTPCSLVVPQSLRLYTKSFKGNQRRYSPVVWSLNKWPFLFEGLQKENCIKQRPVVS